MRGSYSITKSRWHTAFTLCASWARSFSLATSVGLLLPPIEAGGDEFPMNFRLKSKKLGLVTEVPRNRYSAKFAFHDFYEVELPIYGVLGNSLPWHSGTGPSIHLVFASPAKG